MYIYIYITLCARQCKTVQDRKDQKDRKTEWTTDRLSRPTKILDGGPGTYI